MSFLLQFLLPYRRAEWVLFSPKAILTHMAPVDFAGAGSGTSYLDLWWDSLLVDSALHLLWVAVRGGSLRCKGIKMLLLGLGIQQGQSLLAEHIAEEVELNDR